MLPLDSPRWSQLKHAYGNASDTPGLLLRLADEPTGPECGEIWSLLISSVLHQGEVYPAALAVVPHLVEIAQRVAPKAQFDFIHFIGAVATNAYPPDGADDLWGDRVNAFAAANALIDPLFVELEDWYELLHVASARAAFEGCTGIAQMIRDRADGMTYEVNCPVDDCGVTIQVDFDGARGVAVVDDEKTDLVAMALPLFDPGSEWREEDALARLCAQLARRAEATTLLASLESGVTCPQCSTRFLLRQSVLEPAEL